MGMGGYLVTSTHTQTADSAFHTQRKRIMGSMTTFAATQHTRWFSIEAAHLFSLVWKCFPCRFCPANIA